MGSEHFYLYVWGTATRTNGLTVKVVKRAKSKGETTVMKFFSIHWIFDVKFKNLN